MNNINEYLHRLSGSGHPEVVQTLLKSKIGVNADFNVQDENGRTPLHHVCICTNKELRQGHVKMVDLLLQHRANVNIQDGFGRTPLHEAFRQGHIEISFLLLQHGAALDIQDNSGRTPLHFGEMERNQSILIGFIFFISLFRGKDFLQSWRNECLESAERQFSHDPTILVNFSGLDSRDVPLYREFTECISETLKVGNNFILSLTCFSSPQIERGPMSKLPDEMVNEMLHFSELTIEMKDLQSRSSIQKAIEGTKDWFLALLSKERLVLFTGMYTHWIDFLQQLSFIHERPETLFEEGQLQRLRASMVQLREDKKILAERMRSMKEIAPIQGLE